MVSTLLAIVLFGLALAWSRMSREPGGNAAVPGIRIGPKPASVAVLLFTVLLASAAGASEYLARGAALVPG